MASTSFADFEQHYLALFNWVDQGTFAHYNACKGYIRQRVPCKISDSQGSVDKASTLLLGRAWKFWNAQRHDRTLELLDLYERAGYVDGARLLGPIGDKDAKLEFERPTLRLPLASAMHFKNTAATVLLLDRGMLKVTDVRPALSAFVREYRADLTHLVTAELAANDAFSLFAELHWEDDSESMAQVTAALMRHHIREAGDTSSTQAASGVESGARRRAARASI